MEKFIGSGKIFFLQHLMSTSSLKKLHYKTNCYFFLLIFLLQDDLTNLKFK